LFIFLPASIVMSNLPEKNPLAVESNPDGVTSISAIAVLTFIILLVLTLSGCSSKKSDSDLFGAGGLSGYSDDDLNAELARRFGDGNIPMAEGGGVFRDIRFAFDSSVVDEVGRENIRYNVEVLRLNPDVKIQLEGHCDERGTSEYNLALGQRRAQSVMDIMVSLGITRDRIETISYGAEIPLDPRSNEEAWAKNRRVHFTPFRDRR
jgi:peptidoglycan-associated lipoprotein